MQDNKNEDLNAALVQAADGDLDWAKELISAGADVNGMPLMMAIQSNSADIVVEMMKAGADLNRSFADTTPVVHAISSRYLNIVSLLIGSGADVNLRTPKGITPLAAALSPGRTSATVAEEQGIIDLLKSAGAK